MAVITAINEQILEQKLSELEQARQWSPRTISKLETLIRTGTDRDLFRIDPLNYASQKGMQEQEAIDLFLHAAKIGLFEMDWHLICPACGHPVQSLRSMSRLHAHFSCTCCSMENVTSFDDLIRVAFTISPRIREII